MSSTVTALPRSGWWSWRLTPWIQIRRPLTSRSPSRISTLRKPMSWAWTSTTAPSGSSSSATTRYRAGRSADHGSTPASSNRLDATWPRNTYGSAKRCGTVVVTDGASRRPPSVSTVVRTAQPFGRRAAPRRSWPTRRPCRRRRRHGTRRRRPATSRCVAPRLIERRPRGAGPPSTTGPGPRRSCARCSARPRSPGRCGRRRGGR